MDRRRHIRHELALPVHLPEGDARTIDVSVDGVLLETQLARSIGEQIEFSMIFDHSAPAPLHVRCIGRVVRVEPRGAQWGLAAAIDTFTFLGYSDKPERDH